MTYVTFCHSSIDLSNITAAVYSTELCNRLRGFLSAWPPSGPLSYINELLVATVDFERSLESWNIRFVLVKGHFTAWEMTTVRNLIFFLTLGNPSVLYRVV